MLSSKSTRIIALLFINVIFLILELSVGYALRSLALMADAFHMLNDITSLVVGLWAVLVAHKSSTNKYSFGYLRAEILGAFFNSVFLIALCMSIILEATQRFFDPPKINNPKLIIVVGFFGLVANLSGFLILGGHNHSHSVGHHSQSDDCDVKSIDQTATHSHNKKPKDVGSKIANLHKKLGQNSHFFSGSSLIESSTVTDKNTLKKKSSVRNRRISNQDGLGIHPATFRQGIIAASKSRFDETYGSEPEREMENDDSEVEEIDDDPERGPLLSDKKGRMYDRFNIFNRKGMHDSHDKHGPEEQDTHKSGGHTHADMGMNAMILHVIGDALGNIGVIISGLIIWLSEWPGRFYADPAVSLFITLIILRSTIPLTIATAKILLQATPDHIEVDAIKSDIEALPGVTNCHHVHIWQLSDTQLIASMHIHFEFLLNEADGQKYMETAKAVRKCLHAYGIHSATIQPEFCRRKRFISGSSTEVSSKSSDSICQSSCGLDVNECLLECVDDCKGKPCCNPKIN